MPCPFPGPQMFFAGPNFLNQPKILAAFSDSSKTFVHKNQFYLNTNHLFFWSGTKNLDQPKIFGVL